MAVRLSDAWNDPHPTEHMQKSRKVVADDNEKNVVSPIVQTQDQINYEVYYEYIITELQTLRKEESKRSIIYIALSCIIFAIVFMYIDRLQTKINNLSQSNTNLRQASFQGPFLKSGSQIQEPFQWYS